MYVPLDVNFPDDDKIEAVGLAGSGLYAQALCVAKRTMSDGRVTLVKLRRMGADDDLIGACVRVDLFRVQADDPDAVWISAFLDHNDDAATVEAKRSSDAQRKRSARRKRPQNVQPDTPDASENVRTLEVEVETEIEGEPIPRTADPYAWATERITRLPGEAEAVMGSLIDRYGEPFIRNAMTALDARKFSHASDLRVAIERHYSLQSDVFGLSNPRTDPTSRPRPAEFTGFGYEAPKVADVAPLLSEARTRLHSNAEATA